VVPLTTIVLGIIKSLAVYPVLLEIEQVLSASFNVQVRKPEIYPSQLVPCALYSIIVGTVNTTSTYPVYKAEVDLAAK
jgi:hypothetical protein